MNFNIIEGSYADLDSIHDDFCEDYLWSNELSNVEIRKKYNLTVKEFHEFSREVKQEYGFTRRPTHGIQGKYYYKRPYGFSIQKHIGEKFWYFGFVPTREIAEEIVRLCIRAKWDVKTCKEIVGNWREYIGS